MATTPPGRTRRRSASEMAQSDDGRTVGGPQFQRRRNLVPQHGTRVRSQELAYAFCDVENSNRAQGAKIRLSNDMPDKPQTPDEKLQHEFNRWATAGEGAKMEGHHLNITEKTIRLMDLRPGERVLDLGWGSGGGPRPLPSSWGA